MTRRTILDHSPDGLKRRLADLERQVADLQRVRNPPASYVEPEEAAAAGGDVEAFAYDISYTTPAGTSGHPVTLTTGTASYATSGVSMASSSISLPAGLWLIGVDVEVSGGPFTTGDLSLGAIPWSADFTAQHLAWRSWRDLNWTGKATIMSGSNLFLVPSATTLTAFTYDDLDANADLWGSLWGFQVNASPS